MSSQLNTNQVVHVRRSEVARRYAMPDYQSTQAAGFDFIAAIDQAIELKPTERATVPSGLFVELPPDLELQVRPRSGLAHKHGVTVLNAPGTIDADFRGEIGVILINLGQEPFTIEPGMRIAQGVVAPVRQVHLHEVDVLSVTARGENGFGSSGVGSIEAQYHRG